MGCSVCGANGVSRLTCPHYKPALESGNVKPLKHNAVPYGATGNSGNMMVPARVGTGTKIAIKPLTGLKVKAKLKVRYRDPLRDGEKEAKHMFPGDLKMQQEYVASIMALEMPDVPTGDIVSQHAKERLDRARDRRMLISSVCERCANLVQRYKSSTDSSVWANISGICGQCKDAIGEYYHGGYDDSKNYRKFHKGDTVPLDVMMRQGPQNRYYNATMHHGAKHWSEVGIRRSLSNLPPIPRGF